MPSGDYPLIDPFEDIEVLAAASHDPDANRDKVTGNFLPSAANAPHRLEASMKGRLTAGAVAGQ
jgi:hypothetical protein